MNKMNEINKKIKNKNLSDARNAKNDEFYTELSEINKELNYYSDKFKGKTVFCNCDDPFESNFVKFFLMHFNEYGIKTLYATGYKTSPIINTELKTEKIPYLLCVEDTKKYLKGDQTDLDINSAKLFIEKEEDNVLTQLYGDENYIAGDFRSEESIKILEKSDIVITNPPFSLFREYIALLMKYEKHFLVLGNMNAITYKEIFPLLKNNKIWLGCNNGAKEYLVSAQYAEENPDKVYLKNKKYYAKLGNTGWYTNIDHEKRHMMIPLDLGHKYSGYESQYPEYDNYNAINIAKISNIPSDYNGIMGVPITFLDKYNPEQFEIVSCNDVRKNEKVPYKEHGLVKDKDGTIDGKACYVRILIKKKKGNKK